MVRGSSFDMDPTRFYQYEPARKVYSVHFPNKAGYTMPQITEIFSGVGKVIAVTAAGDEHGFRFVKYKYEDEVLRCVEGFRNHPTIRLLPTKPKFADQKHGQRDNFTNGHRENRKNLSFNMLGWASWNQRNSCAIDGPADRNETRTTEQSAEDNRRANQAWTTEVWSKASTSEFCSGGSTSTFQNAASKLEIQLGALLLEAQNRASTSEVQSKGSTLEVRNGASTLGVRNGASTLEIRNKASTLEAENQALMSEVQNRASILGIQEVDQKRQKNSFVNPHEGNIPKTTQKPKSVPVRTKEFLDNGEFVVGPFPPISVPEIKANNDIPELVERKAKVEIAPAEDSALTVPFTIEAEAIVVANVHADYGVHYILHLFRKHDPICASPMKIVKKRGLRYCIVYLQSLLQAEKVEAIYDHFPLRGKELIVVRARRLPALAADV